MRKVILIFSTLIMLAGCGKSSSDNPTPPVTPPVVTPTAPSAAVLSLPAQNAVCTTGAVVSDTISTITFTWGAAPNADNYDLYLKNLTTSVTTTQNTVQTQYAINLPRNTPFSWFIVSKSSKTTATTQSDTWKFYNAGKGTIYYAPFPADIVSPTFGQTVNTATVNLTWKGNSVLNNTIANYDVYFGSASVPPLLKSGVTDSFINNVSLSPKTNYYWKVVTRDILGNASDSGVFQFLTN